MRRTEAFELWQKQRISPVKRQNVLLCDWMMRSGGESRCNWPGGDIKMCH